MTRFNDNIFKGILLFVLFLSLLLKSCTAEAQDQTRYFGYEISGSIQSNKVSSNIPQLQNIRIPYAGMRVGGLIATPSVKYKATVGLHYSSASLPYSFDLLTGSVTAQAYLLRMNGIKRVHTFEPYIIGGFQQNQTKYFGTYVFPDRTRNNSKGNEPLQGSTYSTQLTCGAGIEYQLESESGNFIHFFGETNFGLPVYDAATSRPFSETRTQSAWAINFGINFGIARKSESALN